MRSREREYRFQVVESAGQNRGKQEVRSSFQEFWLIPSSFPDNVRGITNEGGLYGERLGWHLPNFPSSSWASGSPLIGNTGAGVRFYRTTFNLNFPVGYDVVMGIELGNLNFSNYGVRVELFVNGWQFGKFVSNLGYVSSLSPARADVDVDPKRTSRSPKVSWTTKEPTRLRCLSGRSTSTAERFKRFSS